MGVWCRATDLLEHLRLFLVRRVGLCERALARLRSILARQRLADAFVEAAAVLLGHGAEHAQHRVDVDVLHQVVDRHDVRADAFEFEALAREAIVPDNYSLVICHYSLTIQKVSASR